MLTRVKSDDDWALLAPLWSKDTVKGIVIKQYQEALRFNADYVAEMERVRNLESSSLNTYLTSKLEDHPRESELTAIATIFRVMICKEILALPDTCITKGGYEKHSRNICPIFFFACAINLPIP